MTNDEEEMCQLVLLEQITAGHRSFVWFATTARDLIGRPIPGIELSEVWDKYMGRDGRVVPSHDLETGAPIRRTP